MLPERFRIHEDMIFKLSHQRSPSEVKLKSMEWAIVTQLNGEKTVAQIGEILSLNPDETRSMFTRLLDVGLLELVNVPERNPFVPDEIFDEIEYQLTYFLGPVAGIIVDDTLTELKRNRKNMEKKQLAFLVELLTLEISSVEKRYEFQKRMLNKIKGIV